MPSPCVDTQAPSLWPTCQPGNRIRSRCPVGARYTSVSFSDWNSVDFSFSIPTPLLFIGGSQHPEEASCSPSDALARVIVGPPQAAPRAAIAGCARDRALDRTGARALLKASRTDHLLRTLDDRHVAPAVTSTARTTEHLACSLWNPRSRPIRAPASLALTYSRTPPPQTLSSVSPCLLP